MAYGADDIERVLVEVLSGKPPTKSDTAEIAILRKQLTKECDEIKAQGKDVEVPHEMP